MVLKQTCFICQRRFVPNPRLKDRQKTCAAETCRKELKRRANRSWRERNPDYFKGRYETMLKAWYEDNKDYKTRYRRQHREYVKKNKLYVQVHRQKNPPRS